MATLYPIDKKCALERIRELDAKPFLTEAEQKDYQNRIEIVEDYNKQFNRGAGEFYHLPTKWAEIKAQSI